MQKRSEKEQVITELHDKLAKAKVAIVATPKDIDVGTITELRKKFRASKVEYKVVKNTLAKRASKGTSAELLGSLLEGPTALVMGFEDPVSPAKVLFDFLEKQSNKMTVKGAVLDGKLLDANGVKELSKLPGLPELRAMILGMITRPAQMIATILNQPSSSIARAIQARVDAEGKKA